MPTCEITGNITDATGTPVENVVVRLSPAPLDDGSAEIVGAVGIVTKPVETLTDSSGDFSIDIEQTLRVRLEIEAISYDREFVVPGMTTCPFHLLGLRPEVGQPAVSETETTMTVSVEDLETVRTRFDSLVLEWSTSITGSYTELDTADLLSGIDRYDFEDPAADSALFYRAHYLDSATTDVSQSSEVVSADTPEEALLCPVSELLDNYLFGVDLTDSEGNPYPASMFEHYIAVAVRWLEDELDIPLVARDIVEERHDHYSQDYGRWGFLQTELYPVIRIDELKFQYPSQTEAVIINDDWIVLEDAGAKGHVQMVPGQGNIADVLLIPGALMPLWSGAFGRVPAIWHISYRAGFEAGELPPDLKHMIGMHAAIGVLNIAGDLIAGAGIANLSVSIPGLSQTIGTTSSATNSGYGARIIEYQKEIKEALPSMKRFYGKATKLVVA